MKVAVIMGSVSDFDSLKEMVDFLKQMGVTVDIRALSAHRTPQELMEYIQKTDDENEIYIAAAGKAAHLPELFEQYLAGRFDLTLAGHAHGGQWRIPGLLNGLIAPNQGLFPKYAGGMYEKEDRVMVVSRGLARESTRVPRLFNRPEYVIVDLLPIEGEGLFYK